MAEKDLKKDSNIKNLRLQVEAVLFSYGDWILASEIQKILDIGTEIELDKILNYVEEKYDADDFAFKVECDVDSKWRMVLKEEFEDVVSEVISNVEIPAAVLKVLSVIAYEQPVTKTRLGEILGKAVKVEVNYLFKNKFLNYEKHGNGKYYRVAKKFYDYFKIEEGSDFRSEANKSIKTFLGDGVEDTSSLNVSESKVDAVNIKKEDK